MTAELPPQITELIDTGARPITLTEITARAYTAPSSLRQPRHRPEVVRPGPLRPGVVRPGLVRPRVVRPGMVRPGVVRPAPAWPGQARPGLARSGLTRPKVRLGWAAAIAVAVIAVGSAGAISAVQLMAAGRPARPSAVRPTGRIGTLLTTAQLRQVTEASRSALAHSARAYITYLGPSPYHAFQSENIIFSGANYSFAGSVINPAASGRPGQVAWFAERLINGQAYNYELDSKGWHWFHYASPGSRVAHVLDPRTMLSVLTPGERFRFAGRVVAAGVTLERLQASDPAKMPDLRPLTGTAGKHVTALAVLVDSRGVVHQVNISLRGPTLTAAAGLGKPLPGKASPVEAAPAPFAVAGSTSVMVTFADIGQPQYISAPRHAIRARVLWGGNSRPLPPPVMLSADVAGN